MNEKVIIRIEYERDEEDFLRGNRRGQSRGVSRGRRELYVPHERWRDDMDR